MNAAFNKESQKRMAAEEASKGSWKRKPEPTTSSSTKEDASSRGPSSPVKKRKNFAPDRHPYEMVVKGKRVAEPNKYNSTYERMVYGSSFALNCRD